MSSVSLRFRLCLALTILSIVGSYLAWPIHWFTAIAVPGAALAYGSFLGLQGTVAENEPLRRSRAWRVIAVASLSATLVTAWIFALFYEDLTFEWPPNTGSRDVRGTVLTPKAEAHRNLPPTDLVAGFGGDRTQVWTIKSIHRAETILAFSYLALVTSALLVAYALAESFRSANDDPFPGLRRQLGQLTQSNFRLFISYRRANSSYIAGRLRAFLESAFDEDTVFLDVDSVAGAADFQRVIQNAMDLTDVALVIIGKDWNVGMSEPVDFVREEVELALKKNIPILPVFVDGQHMPEKEQLPPSIRVLTSRNGMPLRPDPDFDTDAARILAAVVKLGKRLT